MGRLPESLIFQNPPPSPNHSPLQFAQYRPFADIYGISFTACMHFCGKRYGLWAACLLTLLRLYGQQPYYYNVQQYGADDGFKPWQATNTVTEDRDGFIWIGTDNGLYQFDGKFFKQYIHAAFQPGAI
jgi:hypothetical protein